MFSVNNFYNVLHQNLLKPLDITGIYFYPFGSWNLHHLKTTKNQLVSQRYNSLQLLFWDQEPFNIQIFSSIQSQIAYNEKRKYQGLIYSDITKLTTTNRLNWYYFYHGFATLDWYRDAKYLSKLNNDFSHIFITLNRLTNKERSYRLGLVADIIHRKIDTKGLISCNFNVPDEDNYLAEYHKNLLNKLDKTKNLVIDQENILSSSSAAMGLDEIELFQSVFVHLVTETLFYGKHLHLTEKIFRPIVTHRPFILAGCAGNLSYLKRYGFETFSNWWDESYDTETDDNLRLIKIVDVLEKLSKYSLSDLKDMYNEMRPVLDHNFELFFNKFRHIIVSELVNNFQNMLEHFNSLSTGTTYDYSILDLNNLAKHWSVNY